MYLDDPFQPARPVEIKPQKVDQRLLEFGEEVRYAGRGHTVSKPQRGLMQHGVCVYLNGRHSCYVQSDYCPAADPRVYTQQEQPIAFRPMTRRPQ